MANPRRPGEHWVRLDFPKPDLAPEVRVEGAPEWARISVPWRSNGGGPRKHPDRALPFSLTIPLPDGLVIEAISIVGVFALHAEREHEAPGTVGGAIGLIAEGKQLWRLDLVNDLHYRSAFPSGIGTRVLPDRTMIDELGSYDLGGKACRMDLLTIPLPKPILAESLVFRDLGSPASFAIFEIGVRAAEVSGCPFHSGTTPGVSLSEIPGIIRVGDRVRLGRALDLLRTSILEGKDFEEVKGEALTFLAVVTAASLELGGGREMHRVQLQAARELDTLRTAEEVADATLRWVDQVLDPIFTRPTNPTSAIVDRALAVLDRNYARNISDDELAHSLGLSTSHFRHLFRQATGQPFHKYLIALRLEKARRMLVESDQSVSSVAMAVGFTSLSHFSRAFAQRFSVSPVNLRRMGPS